MRRAGENTLGGKHDFLPDVAVAVKQARQQRHHVPGGNHPVRYIPQKRARRIHNVGTRTNHRRAVVLFAESRVTHPRRAKSIYRHHAQTFPRKKQCRQTGNRPAQAVARDTQRFHLGFVRSRRQQFCQQQRQQHLRCPQKSVVNFDAIRERRLAHVQIKNPVLQIASTPEGNLDMGITTRY